MPRISTGALLELLGYEYRYYSEDPISPDREDVRFRDLFPRLASASGISREIADARLYDHQAKALKALDEGKNVILISGTGSGKTEAWFFHAAKGRRTLAIYPTLALANDQIRRLKEYGGALDLNVGVIDARRRDLLIKKEGRKGVRALMASLDLLITNPAFLMNDLKRMATKGSYLRDFISGLEMVVVDELDFYGPRELALLISMIRILSMLTSRKLQVVMLTATLGNPEELAELFTSINGRETEIIRGKPFRVRNDVYLVIGKNLDNIWRVVQRHKDELLALPIGEDLREAVRDYGRFKSEVYKVVELLRSVGIEVPKPELDPAEIIRQYAEDEGVTIVFTPGIRSAESLRRRLTSEYGLESVAAHHHLVPKDERERIEEAARRGTLKILLSPRTLSQGIDIGTVVRIVHLGLPEDVREFRQREGRKGRREELGWTETVIFPIFRWDRELLLRGIDALRRWVQLPLEMALINPKNKYSILFEALYKMAHQGMRDQLTEEEISLLKELGLVRGGELSERGKRVWEFLNFYEFGPPYGFKRAIREGSDMRYLEDIGHCDLVERFQPGCIDYSADAIVVDFIRRGRVVTGVIEEPLDYSTIYSFDPLAFALEEYEKTKLEWGEKPDLIDDYFRGRLASEVVCVVDPPTSGFGLRTKIPNRVYWKVTSEKVRPISTGEKTVLLRDSKSLPVIAPTGGVYRDYTYGLSIELSPEEDLTWMRVGLALLMVALRLGKKIPVDTLSYDVTNVGDKKIVVLHEPESAGILETLDWTSVKKDIDSLSPDDLTEILLMMVDDQAHYEFVVSGMRWDLAKKFAKRIVDYILAKKTVPIRLEGVEIRVPNPSKAHKILSLEVISVPISDSLELGAIAYFNGEDIQVGIYHREFFEGEVADTKPLEVAVNQGFLVVVWDLGSILRDLSSSGQKSLALILRGLSEEGRVVELRKIVSEKLVSPIVSLEDLVREMWGSTSSLKDVMVEVRRAVAKIERGKGDWRGELKFLKGKLREVLEDRVRALYLSYLALRDQ